MQSSPTPPSATRPGRKPYPLSSNLRRDEYAECLYICGYSPRSIMLAINHEAGTQHWPPVYSERTVFRIIRAQQLKKKNLEWSYDDEEVGEREAVLARMDFTLEKMAVFLATNKKWAPGEKFLTTQLLLNWQMQQAQNRGYIDVPFRVKWEHSPKFPKRYQRLMSRIPKNIELPNPDVPETGDIDSDTEMY